jgi:uncharacterized membrane protein YsdA (DUF1294 family)
MLLNTIPIPLYIGYVVIINLVTAGAYAGDKIAAQRRARRVPEKTLWLLNLLGGVIGAWLVFFGMRHKTRHTLFWVVQAACSVLHAALAWSILG